MPIVRARIAIPSTKPDLDAALEGLVRLNMAMLREHKAQGKPIPPIYSSGVHWQPDRARGRPTETWDSIDVVRQRGYGDCEDLASWRAAELRFTQGILAKAVVRPSRTPGVAWHCIVQLPNGTIEDPSAKLGMYKMQRRIAMGLAGDSPREVYVDRDDIGADLVRALNSTSARLAQWAARVQARQGARK